MKIRTLVAGAVALPPLLMSSLGFAVEVPTEGFQDARIRHVTYDPDQVFKIGTNLGVSTLVVLDPDEQIVEAGTGFSATCPKNDQRQNGAAAAAPSEWFICADKGSNRVWVKPNLSATFNNLEIVTTKRIYSLEFQARKAPAKAADSHAYRVVFDYPKMTAAPGIPTPEEVVKDRMAHKKPEVRNWSNYTMQTLNGGDAIAPTEVFDDDRMTYMLFPGNRELPSIFVIGADGKERRVDSNVDPETGYVVIHEVAKKMVLRVGQATVGIFNEADLPALAATDDGTTVTGVRRVAK